MTDRQFLPVPQTLPQLLLPGEKVPGTLSTDLSTDMIKGLVVFLLGKITALPFKVKAVHNRIQKALSLANAHLRPLLHSITRGVVLRFLPKMCYLQCIEQLFKLDIPEAKRLVKGVDRGLEVLANLLLAIAAQWVLGSVAGHIIRVGTLYETKHKR